MGKTYEKNMADTALVVKSLKVLENIDGGGIKEIKNTVEAVKKQTTAQAKQQEEYWKSLSDDGVITVIEKQTLYRETQNIARSYAAITQQAAALQITAALLNDFVRTYEALHAYLYTTLKVFDDMSSETVIDDRNTFNTYFSNYYFEENFVLIAITAGILDTLEFRVLESLTEPGEEGETAIYQGGLYQYVNGAWKSVTTGAYKGPRTELPGGEEGAFFIVSESFTLTEGLIINGEELYVNGEALGITHTYIKGLIYYCQDGVWIPENDKTNWRYAAAFADVINITGELPQIFQDAIDDLQEQIDSNVQSLEEEIATKQGQYTIISGDMVLIDDAIQDIVVRANGVDETLEEQAEALRNQAAELEAQGEDVTDLLSRATVLENQMAGKISHLPVYFGARTTVPSNPQEGDFYLFTGTGTDNSKIKRYTNGSWETLDPGISANRNYYMMALEDILAANNPASGYFNALFAQAFFTACADITTLDVKTIYLRQTGAIQSANVAYDMQRAGLRIDSSGNIDANGNMHFGASSTNKVAIGVDLYNSQNQYMPDFNDYDVVIGGRTKIKGILDGATGTFRGALSGASGTFEGSVSGESGKFNSIVMHNLESGSVQNASYSSEKSAYLHSRRFKWSPYIETSECSIFMDWYVGIRVNAESSRTATFEIYLKKNGNVTEDDYDYHETITHTFRNGSISRDDRYDWLYCQEYIAELDEIGTYYTFMIKSSESSLGNNSYFRLRVKNSIFLPLLRVQGLFEESYR